MSAMASWLFNLVEPAQVKREAEITSWQKYAAILRRAVDGKPRKEDKVELEAIMEPLGLSGAKIRGDVERLRDVLAAAKLAADEPRLDRAVDVAKAKLDRRLEELRALETAARGEFALVKHEHVLAFEAAAALERYRNSHPELARHVL